MRSSQHIQKSLASSFLLRAGLVGLALGVCAIGLIENAQRFADPQAIHAERTGSVGENALPEAQASDALDRRGDRLDLSALTVPMPVSNR